MSDSRERLKKLLDGDLETSDIATDASLISLADRLYGIKIANVKPVKARDFSTGDGAQAAPDPVFGQTSNLMVEVISSPVQELPDLPHLSMPELPKKKSKLSIRSAGIGFALIFVIGNLFGLFSALFDSACEVGTCRGDGQTRLNLMSFYKFGESDGWSYSLLADNMDGVAGGAGGIGIPDIVAMVILCVGLIISIRKK